jgi:aldehyde dehydrogenase (NAD+)
MNIQTMVKKQRTYFNSGITKDLRFRKKQLQVLRKAIIANEALIMDALKKDLNKSPFESYETEIGIILEEIKFMLCRIDRLARPRKVRTPITHFLSYSKIYQEPYGDVLIMSPWNYPFQLTIAPLIGAIAAGNCAVIKPSNYSENTSAVIHKIISQNFNEQYIAVVEGDIEVNQTLLEQKFDYIFFTGSVEVGKIVMTAAARNLTPVTLELGGKSPCIVDETANIQLAAKRVVWGKFLNAGQTCVAPDYVLVHRSVKSKLLREITKYIRQFYGDEPQNNPEYPKIINAKHFKRLLGLLPSGTIVCGGQINTVTKQIAPTVLDQITWVSAVMQEEIFGPILPVLEFDSLKEVVPLINKRAKPLALYIFTTSKKNERYVLEHVPSGGGCINDTIVHLANPYMSFGGVGDSGMGSYHGETSFRTFSHEKGILKKSNMIDIPLRYPPYRNHLKLLKKILK